MKIIIISGTQVNYGDDRGGVHEDEAAICDVPKETAIKLTTANRALYVNKSDDPFKDGRFTASPEMVKAAEAMAKAKAKGKKAADPVTPQPGETGNENPDA